MKWGIDGDINSFIAMISLLILLLSLFFSVVLLHSVVANLQVLFYGFYCYVCCVLPAVHYEVGLINMNRYSLTDSD